MMVRNKLQNFYKSTVSTFMVDLSVIVVIFWKQVADDQNCVLQ